MHVVLWDTRRNDVQKDFAGGLGVGMFPGGGGLRGRFIRRGYLRDHRPVALNFAYLAAIFRRLGHSIEYVEDREPPAADLYVFNPALLTLRIERGMMARILRRRPGARILVTGQAAFALPEAFSDLQVTVVRGEAEQLLWKLDEVLESDGQVVGVGSVEDLDALPWPDWSLFAWRRFRIKFDFWRFPTALILQSRGCTFRCNYCPYILVESKTRFRDPDDVVDEIRHAVRRYGFRSFKFRDPLFGLDRRRVPVLAERIAALPRPIQFSVESRIDLMNEEILRLLARAGLTSITVGIETPDVETLRRYRRANIREDRQRDFIRLCRRLGIRTVGQFLVGFPEGTEQSVRDVLCYARSLNPTFANFNVVTPYPGTQFFQQVRDRIADFDFSKYDSYTPVMKYRHLSAERLAELHARCFRKYYFRSRYLKENAHLLWPVLRRLGIGVDRSAAEDRPGGRRKLVHEAHPHPAGRSRFGREQAAARGRR